MTNEEKYIHAFTTTFEVGEEEAKTLQFQGVPAWDSVGHVSLIAALEEAFDIALDPDDILDLSSFEKGREILSKYNITV